MNHLPLHSMPTDTPFQRASALIRDLDSRLSAGATATATLQAWCEEHSLSHGAITAVCDHRGVAGGVGADVLEALKPHIGEPIHYRRVQLVRGNLVLADAENWFLPERLLPGMREALESTDQPFGQVITPLSPFRRTIRTRCTAFPLGHRERHPLPDVILEHTAVVISGDEVSLAVVKERFRQELVSFALPEESGNQAGTPPRADVRS